MEINSKENNDKIKYLEELNNEQKKLYKISNILCKEIIGVVILLLIFASLIIILDLASGGDWSGLATGLVIWGLFFLSIPLLLFYLGLENCKKYLISNNKKILNKVKMLDIFSLVINILYVLFLFSDEFGMQGFSLILIVGYVFLFIIPNIIHLLLCFNLKTKKWILIIFLVLIIPLIIFKISIVSPEKIEVDFNKLPTTIDFNNELIKRQLLPESYYNGLNTENNYSYIEKYFESDWENGFYDVEKGEENNKYSMYRYDRYKIKVNGMDVEWEIYSVNNKIYAYLDDIWEDSNITDSEEKYNLSKGIVVSEEEKITTYNDNLKYYSYGGGIMKNFKRGPEIKETLFGNHITEISFWSLYMVDKYNSDCADIVVVDEINATSLTNVTYKIINGENY